MSKLPRQPTHVQVDGGQLRTGDRRGKHHKQQRPASARELSDYDGRSNGKGHRSPRCWPGARGHLVATPVLKLLEVGRSSSPISASTTAEATTLHQDVPAPAKASRTHPLGVGPHCGGSTPASRGRGQQAQSACALGRRPSTSLLGPAPVRMRRRRRRAEPPAGSAGPEREAHPAAPRPPTSEPRLRRRGPGSERPASARREQASRLGGPAADRARRPEEPTAPAVVGWRPRLAVPGSR